jgi:hypothetical protein
MLPKNFSEKFVFYYNLVISVKNIDCFSEIDEIQGKNLNLMADFKGAGELPASTLQNLLPSTS